MKIYIVFFKDYLKHPLSNIKAKILNSSVITSKCSVIFDKSLFVLDRHRFRINIYEENRQQFQKQFHGLQLVLNNDQLRDTIETQNISSKKCFNRKFYINLQVSFNLKYNHGSWANMQILACKICQKLLLMLMNQNFFFYLCINLGRTDTILG